MRTWRGELAYAMLLNLSLVDVPLHVGHGLGTSPHSWLGLSDANGGFTSSAVQEAIDDGTLTVIGLPEHRITARAGSGAALAAAAAGEADDGSFAAEVLAEPRRGVVFNLSSCPPWHLELDSASSGWAHADLAKPLHVPPMRALAERVESRLRAAYRAAVGARAAAGELALPWGAPRVGARPDGEARTHVCIVRTH